MIIFVGALLFGITILIGLWKGPVAGLVESMKADGSSAFEAYFVVALLFGIGATLVIYVGRIV